MKWWYRKKRSKAWIAWRESVYKRDNHQCVLCGRKKKIMNPHHLLPKSKFPKLKYYISNGVTLCKRCHRKTFRKEMSFVELLVEKVFGDIRKWKLFSYYPGDPHD